MSVAYVIVTGALFRSPESRVSKSGTAFVAASMRVKDGAATAWWRVLCFSESGCAELLRLADGDALSVQGALRVESYEKDGATKVSLSVIADQVMALRQPKRPRRGRDERPAAPPQHNPSRDARPADDGDQYPDDRWEPL